MPEVPALQAQGLALKGDLLRNEGADHAALEAYRQAVQIQSNPVGRPRCWPQPGVRGLIWTISATEQACGGRHLVTSCHIPTYDDTQ